MDKKRREQEERQRKQLELEQILEDNRRRVRAVRACTIEGQVASTAPRVHHCAASVRGRAQEMQCLQTHACSCPWRQESELGQPPEYDWRQLRGGLHQSLAAVLLGPLGHAYALSLAVIEGDRSAMLCAPATCCIAPAKASSSLVHAPLETV